jgi:phage terminase large subunit GpA-like protein
MPKGKRNEALDCRVYGLAALHILNPNLDALAQDSERQRMSNKKTQKQESENWIGADDWNFS